MLNYKFIISFFALLFLVAGIPAAAIHIAEGQGQCPAGSCHHHPTEKPPPKLERKYDIPKLPGDGGTPSKKGTGDGGTPGKGGGKGGEKQLPETQPAELTKPDGNLTLHPEKILGNPIYIQKTDEVKLIGSTILNLDPMTIEATLIINGTLIGVGNVTEINGTLSGVGNVTEINVTETITTITTEKPNGEYQESKGVLVTPNKTKATYTGVLFSSYNDKGDLIYHGFNIYSSDPQSTLGFLNGMIGLSLYKHNIDGTFSGEVYEWR